MKDGRKEERTDGRNDGRTEEKGGVTQQRNGQTEGRNGVYFTKEGRQERITVRPIKKPLMTAARRAIFWAI
jgi:hypothetical protein